jgi:hypothetical protein
MANVRVKKDTGNLYFDFQFMKPRYYFFVHLSRIADVFGSMVLSYPLKLDVVLS